MEKNLEIVMQKEVLGKEFKVYGSIEAPLFLAKNVAEWIEYGKTNEGYYNVSKMLLLVDKDEKVVITNRDSGVKTAYLTEDGLYEVLMQSRKPIAKEFKKKVKEILRTIRKTGGYVGNGEMFVNTYFPFLDEQTKILMFREMVKTIDNLNEKLEEQQPAVEFTNTVLNTEDNILVRHLAKIAHNNGIEIGEKRLYGKLREWDMIMKETNEPYQKYIDMGVFKVKARSIITPYGSTKIVHTLMVTPYGQVYIINKLRREIAASQQTMTASI